MKLRNKKTGEIVERSSIVTLIHKISSCSSSLVEAEEYSSIRQFNEEWEDYKPAEPLIKDEKIRKAVRAWAELHELESVFYFAYTTHKEISYLKSKDTGVVIDIVALPELEDGEIYTITELCGEVKE